MPLVLSNAGLAADSYADGTYDGMPLSADFDEHYGSSMDTLEGNFSSRVNVLDPTEGANYTGGSDWTPGMPLVMSNAGLAGLDAVSDDALRKAAARAMGAARAAGVVRIAGQRPLSDVKSRIVKIQAFLQSPKGRQVSAATRQRLVSRMQMLGQNLRNQRMTRGRLFQPYSRRAA
jgi:hypothetical protein